MRYSSMLEQSPTHPSINKASSGPSASSERRTPHCTPSLIAKRLSEITPTTNSLIIAETREYLNSKELAIEDYRQVWKGIFSAMWSNDQVESQERMCEELASLVLSVNKRKFESVNLWAAACFSTMSKEWEKIDYKRVNKYQMLMRTVIIEFINYLRNKEFNVDFVRRFNKTLSIELFSECPTTKKAVGGLALHVIQIYPEILELFTWATHEQMCLLLEMFLKQLSSQSSKNLRQKIKVNVFECIAERKANGSLKSLPNFNANAYRQRLFEITMKKKIEETARCDMYEIIEIFDKKIDLEQEQSRFDDYIRIQILKQLEEDASQIGEMQKEYDDCDQINPMSVQQPQLLLSIPPVQDTASIAITTHQTAPVVGTTATSVVQNIKKEASFKRINPVNQDIEQDTLKKIIKQNEPQMSSRREDVNRITPPNVQAQKIVAEIIGVLSKSKEKLNEKKQQKLSRLLQEEEDKIEAEEKKLFEMSKMFELLPCDASSTSSAAAPSATKSEFEVFSSNLNNFNHRIQFIVQSDDNHRHNHSNGIEKNNNHEQKQKQQNQVVDKNGKELDSDPQEQQQQQEECEEMDENELNSIFRGFDNNYSGGNSYDDDDDDKVDNSVDFTKDELQDLHKKQCGIPQYQFLPESQKTKYFRSITNHFKENLSNEITYSCTHSKKVVFNSNGNKTKEFDKNEEVIALLKAPEIITEFKNDPDSVD